MTSMTNFTLKQYRKEQGYSYTLGAYATIEMIQARPEIVEVVYIHSAYRDRSVLETLCKQQHIPVVQQDKAFAKVDRKENCFVFGVFTKYSDRLASDKPHILLVHPGDMGNLGTIIRITAGLGFGNLGIVTPGADPFHPKTIRASMGALFRIQCCSFPSFESYRNQFGRHDLFSFMLRAATTLTPETCPVTELFTLIFGNEAAGLDEEIFSHVGTGLKIAQTPDVDSLNLSIAAGIGAYLFASKNKLI
uniref:TrmH family RNA methyltransferase n=1 Tax=Paenibacillus terrae TaxID=159743 RepID=UPI0011A6A9EB|nr:RNA methyltransferase [Paenibacillus terrae]